MPRNMLPPEIRAQIQALCVKSFDARDAMAADAFWDVRFSTVHECWEHCHGGVRNTQREKSLAVQRRIIADCQGEINALAEKADVSDWYNDDPELNKWYDAEDKRRVAALAELFVEQDY